MGIISGQSVAGDGVIVGIELDIRWHQKNRI